MHRYKLIIVVREVVADRRYTLAEYIVGGAKRFVLSSPFPVCDILMIPGLLIFLHGCEIKSGSGL